MPETLSGYMGGRYAPINNILRGLANGPTKAARVQTYRDMTDDVASMEGELRARPRVARGTLLYRRCGNYADFRTQVAGGEYRVGDTFQDPAFLSSSRSIAYRTPQGAGQLVAVITVAETSRGHDVMAVRNIGPEMEILFERGTRFLIKKVSILRNPLANNVLWEMTELTGT